MCSVGYWANTSCLPQLIQRKVRTYPWVFPAFIERLLRRGDRPVLVHTIRLHVDWANKNFCQGSSPRSIATTPVKKACELTRLSSLDLGTSRFPLFVLNVTGCIASYSPITPPLGSSIVVRIP